MRWNFSGNKDDYVEEALMDLERFCSRNLTLAVQSYANAAKRHSQRPVVPVHKATSVCSSTTLSMLQAGEAPGEAGSASAPERVRRG